MTNGHGERVRLSIGNWIALMALAFTPAASLGGYVFLVAREFDNRLVRVETKLDVLSTERPKVTDGLAEQVRDLREDIRQLRAEIRDLRQRGGP